MQPKSGRVEFDDSADPVPTAKANKLPAFDSARGTAADFERRLHASDPILVAFNDCLTPMVVCDPTLPDNPLVYVNAAFERMTGFAATEVLGRNCRFMQGPLTDPADVEKLRIAVGRHERIELDLINHRRDGTRFWNRLIVSPVFDEGGDIRWFVASQFDVTFEREPSARPHQDHVTMAAEVFKGNKALAERETELTLALALRAGSLGTWTFNPLTRALATSDGCKAIFGRTPDMSLIFDDFLVSAHSEDRGRIQDAIAETLENGAAYNVEYRIFTPAGEQRWVHVQAALQPRVNGELVAISGFVTDVSTRKFAEEHQAVLARELTHRVKNTLATVGAVVSQTLRDSLSLGEARKAVAGRIASLATAHDLLVQGEIGGAAISDIVERVLAPFVDRHGERFSIAGPAVRLTPEITLALSMTLYELATNAIKYGALSTTAGFVTIEWSLLGAVEERRFSFSWKEAGGPIVVAPSKVGFGTRMIERVLARHVRGEAALAYPPDGVSFCFEGPV